MAVERSKAHQLDGRQPRLQTERLRSTRLNDHDSFPIDPRVLGGRFQSVFPSELTAIVALESGRVVRSAPFRPSREHLRLALGKDI